MNSQFTDKHLASLASIMLLAPAVNFMMKEKDMDIKPEEEGFVRSYIHYGYDILIVLGLALIDWSIYALFFPLTVLYWVNYSLLGIVLLMIVIGIFAILNNKTILQMNTSASGERATVKDLGIIAYFMPLYNYYLFYNETLDNHNYRWVKESVLWRSLYLIIISIRPNVSIIFLGLFLIIARAIMIIL